MSSMDPSAAGFWTWNLTANRRPSSKPSAAAPAAMMSPGCGLSARIPVGSLLCCRNVSPLGSYLRWALKLPTGLKLARRATFAVTVIVEPTSGFRLETVRSEEHTSELQSLAYLVCRLLLEKKK